MSDNKTKKKTDKYSENRTKTKQKQTGKTLKMDPEQLYQYITYKIDNCPNFYKKIAKAAYTK